MDLYDSLPVSCTVYFRLCTDVSVENVAPIFRVHFSPDYGDSMSCRNIGKHPKYYKEFVIIRYDVTAVKISMLVSCVVMSCELVGSYRCFEETFCLHLRS